MSHAEAVVNEVVETSKRRGRPKGSGGKGKKLERTHKPFPIPSGGLTGPISEIDSDQFSPPKVSSFVNSPRAEQWAMEAKRLWYLDAGAKLEAKIAKLASKSDDDLGKELSLQKAEKAVSSATSKVISSNDQDAIKRLLEEQTKQMAALQAKLAALQMGTTE